jgi:hypothetical protein
MEERMARLEGAFEQMDRRLGEFREEVRNELSHLRWEVRIWFGVLVLIMMLIGFLS